MENRKQGWGEEVRKQVSGLFTEKSDILSVIKEDHKPLKELIEIMKNDDLPFERRMQAFVEFAPLLMTHAKSEEQSLYEFMKTVESLRPAALEGDTEHSMADQLCEEIKRSTDEDMLSAKIKVLAEAVAHHIKEEENEIFPEIKEKVDEEQLKALTAKYIDVQTEIISQGQDDSPHESEFEPGSFH